MEASSDRIEYFIVAHGLERGALELVMNQFNTRRAGVRPDDESLHVSIPVLDAQVESTLSRLITSIAGRYKELHLLMSIRTQFSWAEATISPEVAVAAIRYGATFRVLFASPATRTSIANT